MGAGGSNLGLVTPSRSLPATIDAELDEVLSLLPAVAVIPELADKMFSRLVGCLVEAVLHEIRDRHDRGELSRAAYLTEICSMVVELQERGLLGAGSVPRR